VQRVTALEPDERYLIAWRSRIPYELEFEFTVRELDEPRSMSGEATGELEGSGHWRLFEQDGVTARDVRVERQHDNAVDERARAGRTSRVRIQPRRGHALGRRGARAAARLQVVSNRLTRSG
jgi:hypothetical protein